MMYLLVWIFFAAVSAIVANNKNRNAVGWLFLGLIFGIFAFIIILVLPKTEDNNKLDDSFDPHKNKAPIKDSYYYEIKPSKNNPNEWNDLRKVIFNEMSNNHNIKQNDMDMLYCIESDGSYIKMFKTIRDHKPYLAIESNRHGEVHLDNRFEVVISNRIQEQNVYEKNKNINNVDRLSKLAELKEKGLLTDEEFNQQKEKLLKS